jgi:CBS domain-containing protein
MLTAADVMTVDVITVTPETPVRDIATLLHTSRISGVPVVNPDHSVAGIVSEGDLIGHADLVGEQRRSWWLGLFNDAATLARQYAKTHGRFARDVMTQPVISVAASLNKPSHHDRRCSPTRSA